MTANIRLCIAKWIQPSSFKHLFSLHQGMFSIQRSSNIFTVPRRHHGFDQKPVERSVSLGNSTGIFHTPNDHQTISEFVQENMSETIDGWKKFEENWKLAGFGKRGSWETQTMLRLYFLRATESAKSLIAYIRSTGKTPNISTFTSYIAVLGLSGANEELLFETYDELSRLTDVFDAQSCKNLIVGYSHTTQWRKSLEFLLQLEKVEDSCATVSFYSPIVCAAFRNGDFTLGYKFLNEMLEKRMPLLDYVCSEFIKQCDTPDSDKIQNIFRYMRKFGYFPTIDVATQIEDHFRRSNDYKVSRTSISQTGTCKACGEQLRPSDLSTYQFERLQKAFLRDSFVTDNPYLKSTPNEVHGFLQFLRRTAPYDVVIDALNVVNHHRGSIKMQSKNLRNLLDHFQNHRVLLLTRKYMIRWPIFAQIENSVNCFFTADTSQDDPFMLYATLYSGPAAMFVSRDEMGDHRALMGEEMGDVFTQWQRARQIVHDLQNGRVILTYPKMYDTLVQWSDSGWHIPYSTDVKLVSYQHPDTWLCVHKANPN